MMTDGDLTTKKDNSRNASIASILRFDLGADNNYCLDKFRIFIANNATITTYSVYVSDTAAYTDDNFVGTAKIGDVVIPAEGSDTLIYVGTLDLNGAKGRYITVKSDTTGDYFKTYEIVVTEKPDLTGNLAAGKQFAVTRSGDWYSSGPAAVRNYLTDGQYDNMVSSKNYSTAGNNHAAAVVDLGTTYDINRMVFYTTTTGQYYQYNIYGSLDGTNYYKFNTAYTRTWPSKDQASLIGFVYSDGLLPARYLKVEAAGAQAFMLSEIAVYGDTPSGVYVLPVSCSIVDSTAEAEINIYNASGEAITDAALIFAGFDSDDRYVGHISQNLSIEDGAVVPVDTDTITFGATPETVKIMLWNSIINIRPLTQVVGF